MSAAYRDQTVARLLEDEVERVALTEHLLSGRVTDERTLWEIADLLRVPGHGPYLVVAARCPVIGKQALPGIANKLRSVDIYSAWRLSPDQHIGIVQLRSATTRPTLLELLQRLSHDRVGVSAPFEDLAGTARALRYARIALNSRSEGSNVTQFDDSVLGISAVTEPDITTALADRVLAGLNRPLSDDRRMLADTFNSWVNHGGSVTEAAADLVCHPNTVRHRLHRIEELTRGGQCRSHANWLNYAWRSKSTCNCPMRTEPPRLGGRLAEVRYLCAFLMLPGGLLHDRTYPLRSARAPLWRARA